jgi:hypothetical protein
MVIIGRVTTALEGDGHTGSGCADGRDRDRVRTFASAASKDSPTILFPKT